MDNENVENTEEQPQDKKDKQWKNWGALTRYGSGQGQPSPEAKRAGWAKKKRSQELARYLLGLNFVGGSEKFRAKMAEYFGMDPEEMSEATNEAVILMKQIGKAIEHGDNQSAQIIMERAYGKPKEFVDFGGDEDGNRPTLNITVLGGNANVPPISNSEDDGESENTTGNSGEDTPVAQ